MARHYLYRRAPKDAPGFERGAFWLYRETASDAQLDAELDRFARVEAGENLSPRDLQECWRYRFEPPVPTLGVAVNLDDDVVRVAVRNAPRGEEFRVLYDAVLRRAEELATPEDAWVPFRDSSSKGLIYMGDEPWHAERVPG